MTDPAPRPATSPAAKRAIPGAPAAPAARPRGRPPRTGDQRAEHRTRLVDAAMDAVRRGGPEVSLDQIAESAEVSKPVFYAEFGDKTGLVDAMAVVLAGRVERTVIERLATQDQLHDPDSHEHHANHDQPAADRVIGAIIEALINLIDDEPHLYSYMVRSLRTRDRGLLDNALVRVIHDRAALIIGRLADELSADELGVLTDGVFGFVLGVVESWVATRRPPKDQLVEMVSAVIGAGLAEAAEAARRRPPA